MEDEDESESEPDSSSSSEEEDKRFVQSEMSLNGRLLCSEESSDSESEAELLSGAQPSLPVCIH